MSKNLSYGIVAALITIVLFTLVFDDNEEAQDAPTIQEQDIKHQEEVKYEEYQDIEIFYTNQEQKRAKKSKKEAPKKAKQKTSVQTINNKKIYELVSTGSNVKGYEINIASSSPIPARNPSAFPQIPASIQGTLDGEKFSLIIPSDLGVKDFKIKIKNQETGEVKFVHLLEEHIQAGHSSVLNIDTNNFENIELRSNSSQAPALPPMPSFPKLPSN